MGSDVVDLSNRPTGVGNRSPGAEPPSGPCAGGVDRFIRKGQIAMNRFRLIASTAAPLALVLALAGCADAGSGSMPGMDRSGGMTSPPASQVQADFNTSDVMFAAMLIPHHEQAIEMSEVILGQSGVDRRVSDLAEQIKDAQAPEIELMQSWLDEWGESGAGDMADMDHGGGMMSEEDMAALEGADAAEAARLYLEQMIVHHEGAIEMAQVELADGMNPDAIALAQTIIDAQTAEIAVMEDLLTQI
ncbi:DUF305 domain-containing protein [soil metagenome]